MVSRDVERAIGEAQAIDDCRTRGDELGALAGLPMTVKDTLDVMGMPGSAGLKSLLNRTANDAAVVRCVRDAGAIVWGKSNTPVRAGDWQTYNAIYGTTNNPWNVKRTPGGSSGGSAAAVAAGITSLEIGADIAGSLRIPASFCGVYAHKPTYGVVSQEGLVPPPGRVADIDLAVVGPMARSARDLRLLFSILVAGAGEPSRAVSLKGLRVALWLDEPAFALDPDVRDPIASFADGLSALGASVVPTRSPVPPEALLSTYTMLLFALSGGDLPPVARGLYEAVRGSAQIARSMGAGPLSWAQGVLAYTARHSDWLVADESRAQMRAAMDTFFGDYDVLIAPCASVVAFPHDHRPINLRTLTTSEGDRLSYLRLLEWSALATTCGLPATAMPVGLSASGLPVGVQIVGASGADCTTLAVAEAIDTALGAPPFPPRAPRDK